MEGKAKVNGVGKMQRIYLKFLGDEVYVGRLYVDYAGSLEWHHGLMVVLADLAAHIEDTGEQTIDLQLEVKNE